MNNIMFSNTSYKESWWSKHLPTIKFKAVVFVIVVFVIIPWLVGLVICLAFLFNLVI
jgi:hypothetical protein